MKEIPSVDDDNYSGNYRKYVIGKDVQYPTKDEITADELKKLQEQTMELRNFEIEMYWKRANYFWLFNAALLAGIAVVSKQPGSVCDPFNDVLRIAIEMLGVICSLAWILVNKGSKFWQQNWEFHVDQIEKIRKQGMYDVILCKGNLSRISPFKEYPFSVSKINQLVSCVMLLFWLFLFLSTTLLRSDRDPVCIVVVIALALICCLFLQCTITSDFRGIKLQVGERGRMFSRREKGKD